MSMKIPKKRTVLFFPGIFIERSNVDEIISKYETERFNEEMNKLHEPENGEDGYDKIITEYRDKKSWMKSTNLLCCTCDQPIIGQPIPLPSYIVHDEQTNECVYKGISTLHHSWTCASMYNTIFKDNNTTGYFALKHLHQSWNELNLMTDIPIGIPHTDKQQYGGKLTEKQWEDINKYLLKDSLIRTRNYNK